MLYSVSDNFQNVNSLGTGIYLYLLMTCNNGVFFTCVWDSPVARRLKCLPAMWEACVRFLGQEDPLEEEMATQFSILAWKNSEG